MVAPATAPAKVMIDNNKQRTTPRDKPFMTRDHTRPTQQAAQ
jgi:hypothetical protein